MLTLEEILEKADEITLELQENSITPARVGELLSSLTEQLRLISGGGTVIGASKLSELKDVMFLNPKENDILQRIGTKWTNVALDLARINQLMSWFKLDADGNLYTELSLYSKKELSAYGAGNGTEPGSIVTAMAQLVDVALTSPLSGQILVFDGTHWRNQPLSVTPDLSGYATIAWSNLNFAPSEHVHSWGTITDKPVSFTPSTHAHAWNDITGKPTTFAPSAHNHLWADLSDKPTTFAPSAHDHSFASLTSKPTTLSGYGISDAISSTVFSAHTGNQNAEKHLTAQQLSDLLALINGPASFWKLDVNGNLYTDKNVYSTLAVSAYGVGSGGGGGISYSRLDSWLFYDSSKSGWVLSAFLGKDLDNRVSSLESGLSTTETDPTVGDHIKAITATDITNWNSKLATSIFTAHAANQTTNVKHLTDAQLSSLTALSSYWKLDNDGNLYTERNLYSTGEVSAYGKSTAILADANVVETTGSSTTSVMSQKSVTDALNLKADLGGSTKTLQQIDDGKVNVVSGNNLIDKSKAYKGYYLNTAGYDIIDNDDYGISVPILVNGNLTANMAPPAGMCNVVMDADKNILRRFTTEQYTYQLGDVYVRYSFNQASNFMVNVGDTALPYEEYTDKYDVVSRLNILEGLKPIEFDIDELEIVNSTTNGGISRKYGIDAPTNSDGSNSYTQIRLKNKDIRGNFMVYADILHTGGMTFMTEWGQTNEIIGSGIIRIRKTFTTSDTINIIAFPNNLGDNTTIQRVLRVSRLYILPMDYASYKSIEPFIINYSERKIYEVSPDFDSTTENYGKYRFTSPVSCFDYFENIRVTNPYCFNEKNKIVVRVMPSIYDEFETKWAGINGETEETYLGIRLRSCETWESFDIDSPELTVLKWDGYSGFSTTMTTTQAMRRCVFHITDAYTQKKINGFKIIAKNTRYCIHPESAGNGFEASWKIENCLLDWGGRPNVDNEGGCHIGIGISAGETGLIDKVKCIGSGSSKGIGGHNNGFSSGNFPYRPFILNGAKLTITNTNVGGGDIRFQSTTNVSDNYDILKLENVMNINTAEFYESAGIDANWRAQVVGCDIFTNNLDL